MRDSDAHFVPEAVLKLMTPTVSFNDPDKIS